MTGRLETDLQAALECQQLGTKVLKSITRCKSMRLLNCRSSCALMGFSGTFIAKGMIARAGLLSAGIASTIFQGLVLGGAALIYHFKLAAMHVCLPAHFCHPQLMPLQPKTSWLCTRLLRRRLGIVVQTRGMMAFMKCGAAS